MRLLERTTEQKVVDWWERQNGMQIKVNILGRRGWPDRIFFPVGGKPILIEFKRVGENLRKLQEHIHGELRSRGYSVYTCDSVEQGKIILARPELPEGRR